MSDDKDKKELCIVCAWRAACQKQFALKAGRRCPDFSKDLTLKEEKAEEEKK
ncbi:MAG: hypothetical protein K8I29_15535 [Alphaproteobacteria bacterium]|uniref:Uncharacterized protein n=1 Tax=Candidatus Nitrobium versatile TaxID=2884831 RepID=A0A953JED0_9BACT|nr:hypothetical protein [Candidatus Nitrobium versatile]